MRAANELPMRSILGEGSGTKRFLTTLGIAGGIALAAMPLCAQAANQASAAARAGQNKKPNILVIWGDDIGTWNISHNSRGMMGYKTPNIDRIAKEGVAFTDYYAQQSCTAGRSAFISGPSPSATA